MQPRIEGKLNSVKTLSIVGMCKNAGKTTVLNRLLSQYGRKRTLALTSIGRDGESTDVVTGTEKPGIFVPQGTLIATAKDMLRLCGLMEKLSQYQKVNTGVKQLFGLLAVDSIAGSET